MGAGRMRLVGQVLTESALVAVGGGLVGLLVAYWGMNALVPILPEDVVGVDAIPIDWRILTFAAMALQVFVGLLGFGLHLVANLAGPSGWWENLLYGPPIFTPLLFVNLAVPAVLGLVVLSRGSPNRTTSLNL